MDSLQSRGCDALFVSSLKREEDIKYNPGVKANDANPVLGNMLAGSLGYRTDGNEIKGVSKPGSFAYENGFYIASDLIDAKTQAVIYSSLSEVMEYSKFNTPDKVYISRQLEQLEIKKLLNK